MAGVIRSDPFRGASNLTGRSNARTKEATKFYHLRETDLQESWECRAGQHSAKAKVDIPTWNWWMIELPGVEEGGMSGRNGQRKPGTARGSLRRSRTAKASHISRLSGELAMCLRVGRMRSIK